MNKESERGPKLNIAAVQREVEIYFNIGEVHTLLRDSQHTQGVTYGLRRCELPLRMTSTPPRPAAAITACLAPKSTPTTDMV